MISEKFSFDLDQAELCSFIRLKVTEENVKWCQKPFCKKNGRVIDWHCDVLHWEVEPWYSLRQVEAASGRVRKKQKVHKKKKSTPLIPKWTA